MKKTLLTTTAIVAFAGAASAEVSLTGSAEMGIFNADSYNTTTGVVTSGETQFHSDIEVKFHLSGETDNGLTFGAVVDLDEATTAGNPADDGGSSVFISGSFGTLTLGDTDGALDWALTEAGNVGNPGSLADDETSHLGYNGSYLDGVYDGQILRYDNTFGDFGVAISAEMDDTGAQDTGYAIGLKYNLDLGGSTIGLGLGYQQATVTAAPDPFSVRGQSGAAVGDDLEAIGVSANAEFGGGFKAGLAYTRFSGPATVNDVDHIGLGLGYSTGALSMHANWGQYDIDTVGKYKGYGLAVGYDLGGGASVLAGYSHGEDAAGTTQEKWSIGLGLSF